MNKQNWMARLLIFASYCRGKITLSVVLSIISVMCGLVPFLCVYEIIQLFVAETVNMSLVLKYCGIAAFAYGLKILLFGFSTILSHLSAFTILEKLRMSVTEKFMHAPLGVVMDKSIGEIKNMIVDRIESIEPPLAHLIPEVSGNIVLPLAVFVFLLILDWRMALASLITIPLTLITFIPLLREYTEKYDRYVKAGNRVSSVIVEYIEGIQVVKTFGQGESSYEKFTTAIAEFRDFTLDWMKSTWVAIKLAFAIFPSTLLGTLPVGLLLYTKGALTPAELCLCLMLSMSMVGSLARIEVFMNEIKQTQYIIEETAAFLDMEELPEAKYNAVIDSYGVKLNSVRFSYDGTTKNEVLHGIDLNLPQDTFTALVGPSGGGKSTVAKLIARFWDVSGGEITIGGVNIKNIPLKQLASIVSFVTQDNFLFNCSLLENIRLGNPNATDDQVFAAAKAAQCDDFICKLEHGYDTNVGEAGAKLSGGERQRVAIARMILKNAPIVILDEATAFTDPENEDKIQRSIAALTKGKTLLVIAHRLSTVKNADKIVVLQDGNILAKGNHSELLAFCSMYKDMWEAHIGAKSRSAVKKEVCANV